MRVFIGLDRLIRQAQDPEGLEGLNKPQNGVYRKEFKKNLALALVKYACTAMLLIALQIQFRPTRLPPARALHSKPRSQKSRFTTPTPP